MPINVLICLWVFITDHFKQRKTMCRGKRGLEFLSFLERDRERHIQRERERVRERESERDRE